MIKHILSSCSNLKLLEIHWITDAKLFGNFFCLNIYNISLFLIFASEPPTAPANADNRQIPPETFSGSALFKDPYVTKQNEKGIYLTVLFSRKERQLLQKIKSMYNVVH